jgi:hypothetical protein
VANRKSSVNNFFGVPGANSKYAQRGAGPAGFIAGLWHGFVAPISTFAALGNPAVQSHETRNTGRWYSVGYKIGSADPFALE